MQHNRWFLPRRRIEPSRHGHWRLGPYPALRWTLLTASNTGIQERPTVQSARTALSEKKKKNLCMKVTSQKGTLYSSYEVLQTKEQEIAEFRGPRGKLTQFRAPRCYK